jgi:hypothetical protein
VRAFSKMHPKVCAHRGRGSRGPLPIVVGTLVLVEVERLPRGERRRKPRVLWLWWHGPEGTTPDLELIWRSYVRRFDLEHTFRFLKQSVGWTAPRVRRPKQADRRTWLVLAAYTQLRLAHARVADLRLPWERRYDASRLTPVRVHRAVSTLLVELGTPAELPKPCGRSPGRSKGRLSGRAKRYAAVLRWHSGGPHRRRTLATAERIAEAKRSEGSKEVRPLSCGRISNGSGGRPHPHSSHR